MDWRDDVLQLVKLLDEEELFENKGDGRFFLSFPSVPSNYLDTLDLKTTKLWMKEKLTEFSEVNSYTNNITIEY